MAFGQKALGEMALGETDYNHRLYLTFYLYIIFLCEISMIFKNNSDENASNYCVRNKISLTKISLKIK